MEEGDCFGDGIIYDKKEYKKLFYTSGIVGTSVLGIVFLITLYRTAAHVFRRSRASRIAFHVVLLLQLSLDWLYFLMFAIIPYNFCFYLHLFKYLWTLRLFAKSLHYLSLVWIAKTWFDLRKGRLRRGLHKVFDQDQIVKTRTRLCSLFNEYRFLVLAFIIQLVIATVVSFKTIIEVDTPKDMGMVAVTTLSQFYAISSLSFSLILALSLLYSGNSLRKTLRSTHSLDNIQCQKIIVKVNFALGLIVGCTFMRILVYVSWIASKNQAAFWSNNRLYFWYYFLNTILPVSITNLSLLWLSRRTLPEQCPAQTVLRQQLTLEDEYDSSTGYHEK